MEKTVYVESDVEALADRSLRGSPVALRGARVFVAEDEPMLLWALEEVLDNLGCKAVGSATTVAEALGFVNRNVFDVAILDGQLADGDIQPVFDLLIARGTPVVIASGSDRLKTSARFRNAVILQKPYRDEDLETALLAVMA